MICSLYCFMDIGPRSGQEDCILAGERVFQEDKLEFAVELERENLLMAVCDGMGGHAAGEKASFFVCTRLKELAGSDFSPSALEEAVAVIQEESLGELPAGSGTTLAALAVKGKDAVVFNAGDSRVYEVGKEEINIISHDHSYVQEFVDRGIINETEAFSHPYKNILNFGLGPAFGKVWIKYRLNFLERRVKPGDCFLICSDGVSGTLMADEIHAALAAKNGFSGKKLVEALRTRGWKDNTSFIVAEFKS